MAFKGGRPVYLREEEIRLIYQMFREGMNFPDEQLERIRKEIEGKMNAALFYLETK